MAPTWLEVALNGPWGRSLQPRMPVSVADIVAEGVACARAGAAVIHLHAYDETTGRQDDDAALYTRIIEGIRSRADCIVYPTIPLAGMAMSAQERFAAVEALGTRGLLEMAVVDPGSVNIGKLVYTNPEEHIRHGLELAARFGFHPGFAIYEPGFVRLGAALAREVGGVPRPVYRFMFSQAFRFGFPPAAYALDAYLTLLAEEAPGAPWMVAGLGVDALALAAEAVRRGGHLRTGLEDVPFGAAQSNLDYTRLARARIEAAGGRLASAAEVRRALKEAS